MITYKGTIEKERFIKVYLNGKKVGSILCLDGKHYQYLHKDEDIISNPHRFDSLEECQNSLAESEYYDYL